MRNFKKYLIYPLNSKKIPIIPAYAFNTKIFNKKSNPNFELNSLKAADVLINEVKLRINKCLYQPINTTNLECDKYSISKKIEQEKIYYIQQIEELKKNKLENERLQKQIEIEEKRHEESLQKMECVNRSNLNESENDSFGKLFITFLGVAITAIKAGCEIF